MITLVPSVVLTCCNDECGISFAVPEWWNRGKRETHKRFYCPNGHGQSYTAENTEEELRRERDIARQQLARSEEEAALARRDAEKAHREVRKLKKRASAGTCPCCQRTVSQMARHMKTKHPEFVAEETTNVVQMKVKK